MDPFSHGLWSVVVFHKLKKQLFWVMLFSIFPDLLSSIPFLVWRTVYLSVLNGYFFLDIIFKEWFVQIPPQIFALFDTIYNLSHSIFLFGAVFILLFILKRQKMNGVNLRLPRSEQARRVLLRGNRLREAAFTPILAWGLHIGLDAFSHPNTVEEGIKIFWPISDLCVGIFVWSSLPFTIINAAALVAVGLILLIRNKKKLSTDTFDKF